MRGVRNTYIVRCNNAKYRSLVSTKWIQIVEVVLLIQELLPIGAAGVFRCPWEKQEVTFHSLCLYYLLDQEMLQLVSKTHHMHRLVARHPRREYRCKANDQSLQPPEKDNIFRPGGVYPRSRSSSTSRRSKKKKFKCGSILSYAWPTKRSRPLQVQWKKVI